MPTKQPTDAEIDAAIARAERGEDRRVAIRTLSPGKETVWLQSDDGTGLVITSDNLRRMRTWLETGELPGPARGPGRPKKIRPDEYIALHYYLWKKSTAENTADAKAKKRNTLEKVALASVAASWGMTVTTTVVRRCKRVHGAAAREFIAEQPPSTTPREWGAMLARVMALGVEYAEDLAKLDAAHRSPNI